MELSRKRVGSWGGATGVAGAVLIACTACCIPLLAPLLAWLGVAGLALMGPYGLVAAALGVVAIGIVMQQRRRRRCRGAVEGMPSACRAGCSVQGKPAQETEVAARLPAPIACTLSATDFKERARWLNELQVRALISRRVDGNSVHLTYRLDAADDVEKMVRQEQACCGFLHFDLHRTSFAMELTVTAPADAVADGQVLFGHLVPD